MLTYKPGTPEAQLSDLIDLALKVSAARAGNPTFALISALDLVDNRLAARIRAVSAEMVKTPIAQPEPLPFKVGDRVRVVRLDDPDPRIVQHPIGTEGEIVEHDDTGTTDHERRCCWRVWDPNECESGWHATEDLEHVKEP